MNIKQTVVTMSAVLAFGLGTAAFAGKTAALSSLDVDADGSISRAEAGADAELMARWSDIDLDGDGMLSAEEYAALQPTAAGKPLEEPTDTMK